MKQVQNTRYFDNPEWLGTRFAQAEANAFWSELPESLRSFATREFALGNMPTQILRNDDRNIVLLELRDGPRSEAPNDALLIVHTTHDTGNYCYDGTKCTIEDRNAGGFLAFLDPDFEERDF